MTALAVNNGGGIPDLPGELDIDVEQGDDAGPFISLVVQDHQGGEVLLDLVIDNVAEVDAFLEDVTKAVQKFKEATAKA